ncbi:Alpha-glucosidase, glycosyl hydrolase family GH31 [bacterium A37T11]|nr:Alpha-glucosidase, glycosyl hydrolase family GH31 [bacterium A37T11]
MKSLFPRFKKALTFLIIVFPAFVYSQGNSHPQVVGAQRINPTSIEVLLSNNQRITIDFYAENIFRLFQDPSGGMVRDPEAKPEASILTDQPRTIVSPPGLQDEKDRISISTQKIKLVIDKQSALFQVINQSSHKTVLSMAAPTQFDPAKTTLSIQENAGEYFYGGGVQNGRFSHRGKTIAIENQNSWTDGGVASPTPFFWSTYGYGLLWHTFAKGRYDFGAKTKDVVTLSHETTYLDVFLMIDEQAKSLLGDFYQLTGHPVLLPEFGFYEGHLNAYNRDYWKEDPKGILFEDGKHYTESQKDNGGIKESLNGEKNNFQFSARGVIDRYKDHDMPLGWILPNDGYGAGYGQTETLEGNVQNLKNLGDYARKNGVEIGLWTQSDLHPKPEVSALLQRDIVKEVRDAGVRVLKTDVAWVGSGYSFGMHGVADVGHIMPYYGLNSRPFIISLDGWAGTQRYAAVWTGDQTGGIWEYIRFHIPTYIGSGLSGQPNITSDMDGIFGGKNPIINTRDFQWKAFTPMQLNMDGWGANEKYPHALGEPATSINRHYLKLKSALLPYTYSIAKEAVDGLPIMRALFLEYPNAYTYGTATQYEYLYGPSLLIAPIYQATKADDQGNDIRNGIYLPEGTWIDYFTGEKYEGNRVINQLAAPIWKLPVFVKNGAILPMANPNNHVSELDHTNRIFEIYPFGKSAFDLYEDDGRTEAYKTGQGVYTRIESVLDDRRQVTLTIYPTKGSFEGFEKIKTTEFRINVTEKPKKVRASAGKHTIKLTEVHSKADFLKQADVYYYDATPDLNQFATKGSAFEQVHIRKNPQVLIKISSTDVTQNQISLVMQGFIFEPADSLRRSSGKLTTPDHIQVPDSLKTAYSLTPTWNKVANADYYEIERDSMLYSTIKYPGLLFDGLTPETDYSFKLRAVNKDGFSDWAAFNARTTSDPLEFAIQGIRGETTAANQRGEGLAKLFDFDESNLWHTKWDTNAVPFDLVMDLKTINQLDKFVYLPRIGQGNGVWLKGRVSISPDNKSWTETGVFEWTNDGETKTFTFKEHPTARYIRINLQEAVRGFGSGRELYVFKVPGTESYLPGDINHDRLVDRNDFVSYKNYTGLRAGDADFEGYISKGDLNGNGLIDAYDISVVATKLDEGEEDERPAEKVAGKLLLSTPKQHYDAGEMVEIQVKGVGLSAVNALSFAVPYNPNDYEFVGIALQGVKSMENLTNDRLHSNGKKILYPTFVNVGLKDAVEGNTDLFILKFKAKHPIHFNLKAVDGLLVDRKLDAVQF